MTTKYAKLFAPIQVGKMTVKNRIAMAPLGMVSMSDSLGGFTEKAQNYYIERARGGTGLIVTGVTNANYEEMAPLCMPCAAYNPLWFAKTTAPMNEEIHALGSKIFLQITGGFGRVAIPHLAQKFIAPSAQPNRWDPSIDQREMTIEEIHKLEKDMIACAASAKHANFDGVEIHAVHEGYLMDQFAIAFYNHRTDEYGGSLENRLRLAVNVVKGIKKVCGEDFPVSLRYSLKSFVKAVRQGAVPGEEFEELGKDIEEGVRAAKILEEAGYDMLNVDAGTYDSWYWNHPPMYFQKGMYREFGKILKKEVHIPIVLAGRMNDPEMACAALEDCCDMIGYGRPLLADPYLPEKIRTGKLKDIRPCLSCQQGCLARIAQGLPLSCAVNPACGREKEFALTPASDKKRVLIIGGGLAGMETARVCAIRGHEVALMEKSGQLGGNIIPGSVPDFKEDDRALLEWYKIQLGRLPIDIRLNCAADLQTVEESNADVVVIATGSAPVRLDFGGKNHVCTADDILKGKETAGNDVVIVGGGLVGCETGLWLRQKGKNVTIVEAKPDIIGGGSDMCFANFDMLRDLLNFHQIPIYKNSSVDAVENDHVVVKTPDGNKEIKADTVMVAVGYRAENALYNSLSGLNKTVYNIGDSREVHNIMSAIWDAYQLAKDL